MLVAKQIIDDYKIDLMKKWVGKKVSNILLPPDIQVNLNNYTFRTRGIALGIYDCNEAGYASFSNALLEGNGAKKIDYDYHQGLHVNILDSYNPSEYDYTRQHIQMPSYGTQLEYGGSERFCITKIEIYKEDFILDQNYKNIGSPQGKNKYHKDSIHIESDCVMVIYGTENRLLLIDVVCSMIELHTNSNTIPDIINRKINGYASYENPVTLKRRITIE